MTIPPDSEKFTTDVSSIEENMAITHNINLLFFFKGILIEQPKNNVHNAIKNINCVLIENNPLVANRNVSFDISIIKNNII